MGIQWSNQQKQVIEHRDGNLLVSAAAGSGKTAVLVERIIQMIQDKEHPIDVDELLVVTFTNAAAAEMRERIAKAVDDMLDTDSNNVRLQKQQTLIHNAKIMTIHSFCLHVIRNYFHRIDLEPGFRIADDGESQLLKTDVLSEIMNEYYAGKYEEQISKEDFIRFVESMATGKSDDKLREKILQLYNYSMSYPWPEEWLESAISAYENVSEDTEWVRLTRDSLKKRYQGMVKQMAIARELCLEADGPEMYSDTIGSEYETFMAVEDCESYEDLYQWQKSIVFERLPSKRNYEGSIEKRDAVKAIRKQIKNELKSIQNKFFFHEPAIMFADMEQGTMYVRILVHITKTFIKRFDEKKRQKKLLDFNDLEHLCLKILIDPETKNLTQVAKEYQDEFSEIMVDEYQDSNHVQETIVTAVSRQQKNIFMVGDVKQSIYRFRQARPELFTEKLNSYSYEVNPGENRKIILSQNYRSRYQVTDFVNAIFDGIMGEDLGNVEYNKDVALYPKADYPAGNSEDYKTEVWNVIKDGSDNSSAELEARAAAIRIRQIVGELQVTDKETEKLRPAEYSDIVILLRSMSKQAEIYQEVFSAEGIPLIVPTQTGYFTTLEVRTILSFLSIIDNPMQDIHLAAALKSAIGGFSSEELAMIRANHKDGSFYEAVFLEADENEKVRAFIDMLNSFRDRVPYTPIHSLIEEIYNETGYLDYVSVMPAGGQRRANLLMLIEKAVAYENTSYHGLFHFMRYVEQLQKYDVDYGEADVIVGGHQAVRLMTIHKSKGLEFPIVLLCGMGKDFNKMDERASMILHSQFGIGIDYVDSQRRLKKQLLLRQALSQITWQENLGEELRVLYVAMTRAKEKLILIGASKQKDVEKRDGRRENYLYRDSKRLSFSDRYTTSSFYDLIIPALPYDYQLQTDSSQNQTQQDAAELLTAAMQKYQTNARIHTEAAEELEQIQRKFAWEYPFSDSIHARQKISVSELKHRTIQRLEKINEDLASENTATLFKEEQIIPYIPKFADGKVEENLGALRGTAMHRFLECFDFALLKNKEDSFSIGEYLKSYVSSGKMTQEQADLILEDKMETFFEDEIASRMCRAELQNKLVKERPFVMGKSAESLELQGDGLVLIQGIIDVYWEEDDQIVMLDYKTDAVRSEQQLIDRYHTQLELYRDALEMATGKNVKEMLLYSFKLGKVIKVV